MHFPWPRLRSTPPLPPSLGVPAGSSSSIACCTSVCVVCLHPPVHSVRPSTPLDELRFRAARAPPRCRVIRYGRERRKHPSRQGQAVAFVFALHASASRPMCLSPVPLLRSYDGVARRSCWRGMSPCAAPDRDRRGADPARPAPVLWRMVCRALCAAPSCLSLHLCRCASPLLDCDCTAVAAFRCGGGSAVRLHLEPENAEELCGRQKRRGKQGAEARHTRREKMIQRDKLQTGPEEE